MPFNALERVLDRLDLLGRRDDLIDHKFHVGKVALHVLERGHVGPLFGLEIQPRNGPASFRAPHKDPGHLYLRLPAARTDQFRATRTGAGREHGRAA